ncbi:MAG TPA: DUF885 domain-containing protein, partial [Polyangiaceae bacterium]|nr:DUF885 domain-containing protein [Polyangiaceae bacterium]
VRATVTHLSLVLLAAACGSEPPPPPAPLPAPPPPAVVTTAPPPPAPPSADATFGALASEFLEGFLALEPVQATNLGDHRFDGQWPDASVEGDAKARAFLVSIRTRLATIPAASLSDQNQVDAHILGNQIGALLFDLDELKDREENPLYYTGLLGDGLDPLLTRTFAPPAERMRSLRSRLAAIPAVVAIAKARLRTPPRIHTETAIKQMKGLVDLCEHGLADSMAQVPELRAGLEVTATTAAVSLRDFQSFLEKDLLPRSTGSFRRGPERFAKILRFAVGDDVDGDALVTDARAEMERTFAEMVETARELWPSVGRGPVPPSKSPEEQRALVRRVLARLGDDATDPKTILSDATKLLGDATRFVQEHDLVGVPAEPCRVIEMPEYKRGIAIAYCDSTGPLEKKQETVYAIAPAPSSWPPKRIASFYREYNRSMLVDLTVHEAMPGHYLQAMHANTFHSPVRTVFEDGAFVEGWAVYGEWLMAKNGFGGPRARMQRLKMMLRVCANTLLDHGIHAGQMDEKEALALMTDQAFQEEAEAVGKWTRARVSSGQLSTYFYGYREFRRLREAAEKKPDFHERAYHDRLLASGDPPMRELRWLVGR